MQRRAFLNSCLMAVGGIVLEQAVPLGRVWSFPKKIVIAPPLRYDRLVGFSSLYRSDALIQIVEWEQAPPLIVYHSSNPYPWKPVKTFPSMAELLERYPRAVNLRDLVPTSVDRSPS